MVVNPALPRLRPKIACAAGSNAYQPSTLTRFGTYTHSAPSGQIWGGWTMACKSEDFITAVAGSEYAGEPAAVEISSVKSTVEFSLQNRATRSQTGTPS